MLTELWSKKRLGRNLKGVLNAKSEMLKIKSLLISVVLMRLK